jgi:hypothetical protein
MSGSLSKEMHIMDSDQQARWSFISEVRWPPAAATSAHRVSHGPLPMTAIGNLLPTRRISDVRAVRQSPGTIVTVERSAKNIANWSTYLPADCVAVMVSQGWDRTT